ncbi:chitin synthase chs-2-like [Saccostrea cucullata]|uniref:chitin synthase chs-2-like n=1 Tax=Saccostrea cuccullata TaxID=36930 RepID=UPI002ED0D70F
MTSVHHLDLPQSSSAPKKRKYDIFDKSPEVVEDDVRRNWLDRTHGCLRLLFLLSLFVFILFTAFLSRFSFHIILINLNPPTVFTTLNKFGGDTTNTTASFVPADVHISWVWACFLVLIAPSLHSFAYYFLQFYKNIGVVENKTTRNDKKNSTEDDFKNDTTRDDKKTRDEIDTRSEDDSEDEKTCGIKKASIEADFGIYIPNKRETNGKIEEQVIPLNCCIQAALMIEFGVVQAIGETLAVFLLLPTFDQASAGIIATNMTLLVPTILNGCVNPYFRCRKKLFKNADKKESEKKNATKKGFEKENATEKESEKETTSKKESEKENANKKESETDGNQRIKIKLLNNFFRFSMGFLTFCSFSCLISYVSLLVDKNDVNSLGGIIALTIINIFFSSIGFWENVSGFNFERLRNHRRIIMMAFSACKIVTYFITFLVAFSVLGEHDSIEVLFGIKTNATVTMLEKSIRLVSTASFRENCFTEHPFYVALVSLFASYFCFKASYQACRTYLQWPSFSIPLIINLVLVPILVGLYLKPNAFYTTIEKCSIISEDWDFNVDREDTTSKWMIGMCGALTFVSILMLTTYVWRNGMRIKKLEKIFAMPFYAGYAIDITLLWSRRRIRKSRRVHAQVNNVDEESIPTIYLCATMWHETELEMKTLLRSIFRLNRHQFMMAVKQHYLAENGIREKPNDEFYQFEAHIFFDDAFKESKEKIKPKGRVNNTERRGLNPGEETNEYVTQFIKCIEDTATSFYRINEFSTSKKYRTPYGGRLEWDLLVPDLDELKKLLKSKKDKSSSKDKQRYHFLGCICGGKSEEKNTKSNNDDGISKAKNNEPSVEGSSENKNIESNIGGSSSKKKSKKSKGKSPKKKKNRSNSGCIIEDNKINESSTVGSSDEQRKESSSKAGSSGENSSETSTKNLPNTWTVPCKLILHLKDKALIRKKKRWSQVMYMYFLLSYNSIAKKIGLKGTFTENSEKPTTSTSEATQSEKMKEGEKHNLEEERKKFADVIAPNTFILALDGDVDFKPAAVLRLLERMQKNSDVGAACGRIIPMGGGPVVWYQKFEYAASHWLQKSTEHVYGCVLCSPGCFSLFRASALMSTDIIKIYTSIPSTAFEYVQYDQGEDRWLSTLLLKQGYKLEYTAASDANTYVPEGFFEFFNQRRRWSPSTLANIFDIISSISSVTTENAYVSKLYLVYHMFLFASSIITPGTIFLMILGATVLAFPVIPLWVAFVINITLIGIFMLSCVFAEEKTQLTIASVISAIYALMMVVVLFGLIIDAINSGFCSVTSYFFCYVAGTFLLAAIMHPMEFHNIFYGIVYFLAVPTTSMLLLIYALGNLHVTSWGTRESNKQGKKRKQKQDNQEETSCSCFGICRCNCLPAAMAKIAKIKDKKKKQEKEKKEKNKGKNLPPVVNTRTQLLDDALEVVDDEKEFWDEIIDKYLNPKMKEDSKKQEKLLNLRNSVYAGFIMINIIYITIVFVITQANELNNDVFTVRLPCPNRTGHFDVDPISIVFCISFGLVLFFQLIGMIIHRFSTFTHIVAVSKITGKSFIDKQKKERKKAYDSAIRRMFNDSSSNIMVKSMADRGKSEMNTTIKNFRKTTDGTLTAQ